MDLQGDGVAPPDLSHLLRHNDAGNSLCDVLHHLAAVDFRPRQVRCIAAHDPLLDELTVHPWVVDVLKPVGATAQCRVPDAQPVGKDDPLCVVLNQITHISALASSQPVEGVVAPVPERLDAVVFIPVEGHDLLCLVVFHLNRDEPSGQ